MVVVTQAPLDYQARGDAVAPRRRRFKRAALACAFGLVMAPVAGFVAFVAGLAEQWAIVRLLLPYATLLSGDGTLRDGGDGSFYVALAQFPAYGLIVGAAGLTGERAGRRAWFAIGSAHVLAALGSFAASYAAGRA
jgi:hypothetical protein